MQQLRILIAESDPTLLVKLAEYLKKHKYVVETASDRGRALELLEIQGFDLVVSGVTHNATIVKAAAQASRRPAILALVPCGNPREQTALLRAGADNCLFKPFSLGVFSASLEQAYWRALCRRKDNPPPVE